MFRGQFILLLFKEHCSLFSWKLVLTCSLNHHTMRVTEDEMVGWHHRLNAHEFEQTLGDSEGEGSLVCCSPWGCKELDMTWWLNNNVDVVFLVIHFFFLHGQESWLSCSLWYPSRACSNCIVNSCEQVWGRMDICVCMTESLPCSLKTLTPLFVHWLYPNTK